MRSLFHSAERPEIRQLAEAIISAQQREIDEMRSWRAAWYPDLAPTAGMGMEMGPMCSYLEREGFRVVLACDGAQALSLARSERPDLLILDLMLPGIDGLEVCRRLRTFSDAYVLMQNSYQPPIRVKAAQ